ncbi:unnamed protein product [Ostreobium quekettii]|uniref:BSD domain-containing protein n=1 Tax=Ostreobium quekettii TaxID=121088 RepID=A0A8S1J3B5_9CHLO|nr:unnamed protein product [Ostreobium quekettii]
MDRDQSDTRELYEALVLGGTISESDFWRARSQWHNTDKQAPKQRVGWATALMADVTPKDDGTKKVRLNLSAQTIQQIFAERPWVHKSYSELVPHIMDDKEFWTRFCKHEFAFEAKLQKMAEGKQREAFEIDDEYADLFSEPAQAAEEQHTARVKARCVDPTVNLVANDDDNFGEGYGVLHNARRAHEAAAPGVSHDIIRGINRHGTVILEGVPEEPTEDAATAARRMAMERRSELQKFAQVGLAEIDDESFQQIEQRERHALEDLKSAQTGNFVGLNIRGLHDFLHGRVEEPQTSTPAVGGSGLRGQNRPATSALEALDRLDGSCLVSMPPLGKPASQVLINMFHGRSGRSDDPGSAEMEPGSKAVDVVSPEDQRLLRNRALITNELLRHFWASFPASSPARKAKAAKLKSELWNMHKSLLELREDCNGPARPYILQILKPLLSALEAAFEKYDRDAVHR